MSGERVNLLKDRARVFLELATAMDRYGLPLDYPIELYIHSPTECREILKQLKKCIFLTSKKGGRN
ncbi:hypothetical protein DRO58_02910 [Candidatus Bathyarchaeota archaeon]|nr:MAG: hypothetical protein DRO58_02910 [Candidatus Bathyarchaeota archaeon]